MSVAMQYAHVYQALLEHHLNAVLNALFHQSVHRRSLALIKSV